MHQLDLHVDILYIPNVFLPHRRDTGTTRNASTRYGRIQTLNTAFSAAAENAAFTVQPFGTGSSYEPVPKAPSPEAHG